MGGRVEIVNESGRRWAERMRVKLKEEQTKLKRERAKLEREQVKLVREWRKLDEFPSGLLLTSFRTSPHFDSC